MHDKKIVIASHQMLYGASQALRDYFKINKQKEVLFIGLPLVENKNYSLEIFKRGIKRKCMTYLSPPIPLSFRYILDLMTVFYWCFKSGRKDIFVGVDPLNAVVGLMLKSLGRVSYVIFYSIDFVPKRFNNNFLNFIYHTLEKLSVKKSDESWNVSPRIASGREKFLSLDRTKYPQKIVPIGIWKNEISKKLNLKKKYQIFFVGHLLEKQGVQEVINAIFLVKQKIPKIKFIIAGGGDYEEKLKELVKKIKLESNIQFLGWVKDRKALRKVMEESAVAIACYKPEKARLYNFTYYADPTKLKDYLSAGLPIILTDVSHNAKDIEKNKCGIIVKYKKEDIAKVITSLLMNEQKLILYRKNASKYIARYEWQKIFNYALNEVALQSRSV